MIKVARTHQEKVILMVKVYDFARKRERERERLECVRYCVFFSSNISKENLKEKEWDQWFGSEFWLWKTREEKRREEGIIKKKKRMRIGLDEFYVKLDLTYVRKSKEKERSKEKQYLEVIIIFIFIPRLFTFFFLLFIHISLIWRACHIFKPIFIFILIINHSTLE